MSKLPLYEALRHKETTQEICDLLERTVFDSCSDHFHFPEDDEKWCELRKLLHTQYAETVIEMASEESCIRRNKAGDREEDFRAAFYDRAYHRLFDEQKMSLLHMHKHASMTGDHKLNTILREFEVFLLRFSEEWEENIDKKSLKSGTVPCHAGEEVVLATQDLLLFDAPGAPRYSVLVPENVDVSFVGDEKGSIDVIPLSACPSSAAKDESLDHRMLMLTIASESFLRGLIRQPFAREFLLDHYTKKREAARRPIYKSIRNAFSKPWFKFDS